MFFVLGISVAIFLAFLLLIKKNKSKADVILASWLLLVMVHLLLAYLHLEGILFSYPHLFGFIFPLPVLEGVMLFFYVASITGNSLSKKQICLHLLPTIFLYIMIIPFFLLSGEEKNYIMQNDGIGYDWYILLQEILTSVSGFFYTVWSYVLIVKHGKRIRNTFSNIEKKELQWLKYLTLSLAIIWIVASISDNATIIFSFVTLFVLFIGIFGINQLDIFTSKPSVLIIDTASETQENENKRYAKSGLSDADAQNIYLELNLLMKQYMLYKEAELTLTDVAAKLEIHPNYLSQVINEKEGVNYYTFINKLRVTEFIRISQLPQNQNQTLLSLAFECGFKSKSTFNKHFKSQTGKTPKEFLSTAL